MTDFKKFLNKNIKLPFKNFVDSLDAKVDPDLGFSMYKVFRRIALFWFFIIFPIISLIIGTNAYFYIQGKEQFMNSLGIGLLSGLYFFFLFLFYCLWFYFSKWNDLFGSAKVAWREERIQMKLNKKIAKKEDKKAIELKGKEQLELENERKTGN